MALDTDVKESIDKLNVAWVQFKEEQDKGRKADKEKLTKIEADVEKFDKVNRDAIGEAKAKSDAIGAQADRIEKLVNRLTLGATGTTDEKKAKAAALKEAFESWARKGVEHLGRAEVDRLVEAKALIKSDDTAGGYLAPPEYVAEIIKAEVLISPMRGLVKVRNTARKSIQVPKRTQTAAAVWVGETTTRSESQNPAYGLVEIPTHEMTAEVYISFEELEDSAFDMEAELTAEFSEQFAVSEGAAVVSGNGIAKPFGITDAGAGVTTNATNSGSSAVIADANGVADGIIDCFHSLKTAYAKNASWIFTRKTLGAVRKLKDSQKRYIWEPSPAVGSPSLILGAAYTEVPDMDEEGANKYPMGIGDWKRAYTLVDRVQISVMRDPYTKAGAGQVKFLARRRVGGQVVLAEAIKLLKCST